MKHAGRLGARSDINDVFKQRQVRGRQLTGRVRIQFGKNAARRVVKAGVAVGLDQKQRGGVGLFENVLEFMRLVVGVDGDEHAADHAQGGLQINPLGDVGRPDGDVVPLLHAQRHQALGRLAAPLVELAVGLTDLKLGSNERRMFGKTFGCFANNLSDGLVDKL